MNYLSVCSGIEAATVAWHPLGWHAVGYSEIEPFPCAVLQHHYPSVPNHGDMTQHQGWPHETAVDLLVGGTPCQAFSVAGLRQGLADPRGNLTLVFLGIVAGYRPRWVVWENVPGVLSEKTGAFGAFLGGLAELGYGWAYRVLDAQYFGVAQRRRRVFVVGYLGDWHRAAAVLFERESLSGNPPPSRETRQDTAGSTGDGVARCVTTGKSKRQDWETCNFVTHALKADGFDASEDGTGRGTPIVAFQCAGTNVSADLHVTGTMKKGNGHVTGGGSLVAFPQNLSATQCATAENLAPAMGSKNPTAVASTMSVRRLTPRECERLQGFPDDYTRIPRGKEYIENGIRKQPWAADGPRYKALGNSMAVPVMRWIGERIALVDSIHSSLIPHPSSL